MQKCGENCAVCCDFCVYAIHDTWEDDGGYHIGGPIGCTYWGDEEHQDIAESCGSCNEFKCFRLEGDAK